MRNREPLLSPFISQPAVFAGVYLLTPKSGSHAASNRRHHGKAIAAELNLHPLIDLSLTKRHNPRCCATLQSP
jgi:hypothetical protein